MANTKLEFKIQNHATTTTCWLKHKAITFTIKRDKMFLVRKHKASRRQTTETQTKRKS